MGFIREAYMMPRKVREALEGRFPAETILEVFYAVDDYSRFWDDYRTGEGFDFSYLSPPAQAAFVMVLEVIEEYNAGYYRRQQAQSNNAEIGVQKREERKNQTKRQESYYDKKREEINRKRRDAYRLKKERENLSSEKCKTKDENVIRNVKRKLAGKNVKNQSEQEIDKNLSSQTKVTAENENVIRKASDESIQSQSGKEFAENSAMAHRITGNSNSSLRSELLDNWKEGVGENQVIHNEAVDNSDSVSIPTSGLSGSKAVQTGCLDPVCSEAVGEGGRKGSGKSAVRESGKLRKLGQFSKAVSGGDLPPPSSARKDCVATSVANSQPKPWLSAPHEPGPDEVKITKNFKIDFTDPIFEPYAKADKTVRIGLESWLKKNKFGCSVEKKWLCRQIVSFSRNQGKLTVLMGVDPPD